MEFTYQQIKDLQELIDPPKSEIIEDLDDEILEQKLHRQQIGAGDIGKPNVGSTSSNAVSNKLENSDIWHPSEINAIEDFQKVDPRKIPEYEMKFKQAVGTEDIFLGMNLKTPGTASCEWITLLVKLPAEKRKRIELSVESDVVDVRSPKYRLQLPTPFPVDPNGSSAKWHSDSDCLEITLKLSRELDDVNF